jgi:hypothetical protein
MTMEFVYKYDYCRFMSDSAHSEINAAVYSVVEREMYM